MSGPVPTHGYPSKTAAAEALQAKGLTVSEIGHKLSLSSSIVSSLLCSKKRDRKAPPREKRGSRLLSDAQLDEMCRLRERGWGIERIAQHFTEAGTPVHSSTINWQCMRLGADAPMRFRGPTPTNLKPYLRHGRDVRPYSDADDRQLLALVEAGAKSIDICRALCRSTSSIRGRLLTLARRQARSEEAGI